MHDDPSILMDGSELSPSVRELAKQTWCRIGWLEQVAPGQRSGHPVPLQLVGIKTSWRADLDVIHTPSLRIGHSDPLEIMPECLQDQKTGNLVLVSVSGNSSSFTFSWGTPGRSCTWACSVRIGFWDRVCHLASMSLPGLGKQRRWPGPPTCYEVRRSHREDHELVRYVLYRSYVLYGPPTIQPISGPIRAHISRERAQRMCREAYESPALPLSYSATDSRSVTVYNRRRA